MFPHDNINEYLPFLAASNPALMNSGEPEWDRAFAAWLIIDGRSRADHAFGRFADANRAHDEFLLRVEGMYGRNWKQNPEAAAAGEAAWSAITAAEDKRHKQDIGPLWKAAIALVKVPAPNLLAALFKIELIRREELDNDTSMTEDPFDIVAADLERLA